MIVIGIDPGDHTGFAVWDTSQQAFILLATLPLHKAMQEVVKWTTAPELAPQRKGKKVHIICEDARQRTWFAPERNVSEYRGKLMGAGAAKRDAKIWEEFLSDKDVSLPYASDLGLTFTMHKPQVHGTKWAADYFARVTGFKGRTSEHSRDAVLTTV